MTNGINTTALKASCRLILGTDLAVFELEAIEPLTGIFNVTATHHALKAPKRAKLIGCASDLAGKNMYPGWVGKGLYMNLQFSNLTLVTKPVLSARIESGTWYYEVF